MKRRIEYSCAAIMAIMLMFFAILGIMAVVLTVSAKSPQHVRSIARSGRSLAIHVDAVFWHADTQRIGSHRVAVPHAFVKTVRDLLTDTICQSKYFQND